MCIIPKFNIDIIFGPVSFGPFYVRGLLFSYTLYTLSHQLGLKQCQTLKNKLQIMLSGMKSFVQNTINVGEDRGAIFFYHLCEVLNKEEENLSLWEIVK